jgi:G3E family GTPase
MRRIRFVMIGGFLGAGKATALARRPMTDDQ